MNLCHSCDDNLKAPDGFLFSVLIATHVVHCVYMQIVVVALINCRTQNSFHFTLFSRLFLDMVYLEENKATCRVLDQHPNATQRRLSFLVNPANTTVKQFLEQVSTQFTYDKYDLIFETKNVSQLPLTSRRAFKAAIHFSLIFEII